MLPIATILGSISPSGVFGGLTVRHAVSLPRIMVYGHAWERQDPRWLANEASIGVLFTVFFVGLIIRYADEDVGAPGRSQSLKFQTS